MKILHVTHHQGCKIAIDFVSKKLGYELETQFANWNYNVSRDLANQLWEKYKDYYNSFDCIITSDTAPLARIFLQNNFEKKLIVWVCNRFDYADQSTNNSGFPDPEFYDLFRNSIQRSNVKFRSYTRFEHEYAEKYRNVLWEKEVIRPCNEIEEDSINQFFPDGQNKKDTFFITRYHNDNIFMDLRSKCLSLGIPCYKGEYNGPSDLRGIKGIIHIPYAWSNLAIFENWSMSNVYLIPSKEFLLKLSHQPNFFWSPPFDRQFIESSEWYLPEHSSLFAYFDSWDHLKQIVNDSENLENIKKKVKDFSDIHTLKCLEQWKNIIE
jgi:hypothetical protein